MKGNIVTKFIRDKVQKPYYINRAVTSEERITLGKEVGVHGLVLFEYYLRVSTIENFVLTDEHVTEYFGWNIHTARRHRRALINAGWLHVVTATSNHKNKVVVYYLGKEEVSRVKQVEVKP